MIRKLYKFFSPKYQNLFSEYNVEFVPRYGHGKPPHALLYDLISQNKEVYKNFLEASLKYKTEIHKFKKQNEETDTYAPVWNNGYLPGLDIVMIYTTLAEFKPKRYVEVGSGNSTKVAFRTIHDNELETKITSIDPFPRAQIDDLADVILRKKFEDINYDVILSLEENDILFIDNSHRVLPNSDAMVFFMEILPKLKKGVIVHIHDIYLPYDYPQVMCDRFYSEQYALAAFLMANPEKYKTILPNYFISEDQDLSGLVSEMWEHPNLKGVETHGGSYWIQISD